MSNAPRLLTFGCRLNAYESEVMRDLARQGGAGAETIIVNSCAVTFEAERQVRQAIRRARRDNPEARIVVTGCAAQIDPDRYAAMPEVDRVLGNADKLKAENWRLDAAAIAVNDLGAIEETAAHLIDGFNGRARAFVQIQQGCDHRCTFCIIPFARGNNRSLPAGAVMAQIHRLVAGGFGEIVLTGVDIAAYGRDLPGAPTLGQLVRRILKLTPDLPRLRLSSLDPAAIDDDLWQVLAEEPRLMPHLHLSVQHGADTILKRMKRRHSRADAIAAAARAKSLRPGLALGADIIAGFPTETDAHFADSLALVAECGLTWLHVFAYSPRPGTPAARMPQLPGPVIRERAAHLRMAAAAAVERHLAAQAGRFLRVLIERERLGRCEDFTPVRLECDALPGRLATVRVTGYSDGHLIAASIEAEQAA